MSDAPKYDLIMKFVLKVPGSGSPGQAGRAVYAESALDVTKGDKLMDGFDAASYDFYSNFFEVTNFDFSVAVKPQDDSVGAMSQAGPVTAGPAPAAKDQFSRWRSAKEDEYMNIKKYPIDFDTFSFSRTIDSASPIFFQNCCNQESFFSASLVKRVAATDSVKNMSAPRAYLRFDFADVLLTSFSWSDGDLVTESCTFICKKLTIRYARQKQDNTLLEPMQVEWDQKKNGEAS